MSSPTPQEVQQKRLLRMTIAHYRNENCTEEDFYKWVTEVYTPQVVKIYKKHGLEGYQFHMSPASFRDVTRAMSSARGNRWVVRDHDFQIEMYFRDLGVFQNIGMDPEFQAVQATGGPYATRVHTEASLGWVETYISDGEVVNTREDGKLDVLEFAVMSTI